MVSAPVRITRRIREMEDHLLFVARATDTVYQHKS